MSDSESKSVVRFERRSARRNSFLRRTRLRDTAIYLAILAAMIWLSHPGFA